MLGAHLSLTKFSLALKVVPTPRGGDGAAEQSVSSAATTTTGPSEASNKAKTVGVKKHLTKKRKKEGLAGKSGKKGGYINKRVMLIILKFPLSDLTCLGSVNCFMVPIVPVAGMPAILHACHLCMFEYILVDGFLHIQCLVCNFSEHQDLWLPTVGTQNFNIPVKKCH